MCSVLKCYCVGLFFNILFSSILCDVFTAMIDLQKLLHTEGEIIKTIEKYLEVEEKRLQEVKKIQDEYGKLHKLASMDSESFLANPVNAFLLVKRLSADWKAAVSLMLKNSGKDMIENITHSQVDLKFPEDADLTGAAEALIRLQDTYKLDTSTLARGIIGKTKPSHELTANDCYELGRQSYNKGDHYHSTLWMQEALDRVNKEADKSVNEADILAHLAFSTYMQGNIRHALELTKDLLEIVPDHSQAQRNRAYYEDAINNATHTRQVNVSLDGDTSTSNKIGSLKELYEQYEQLCRSEANGVFREHKNLHCDYFTNNHPYYFLHPVKREIVFKAPRIVIFHDIVSDKEINVIKSLAQPRLKRATVREEKIGEYEFANYRISKSAWLKNAGVDIQGFPSGAGLLGTHRRSIKP